MTDEYAIACECVDAECVETLRIRTEDYQAVRNSPRRFVVLCGHIVPGIEAIVAEHDGYVVVEKLGLPERWRPNSPTTTRDPIPMAGRRDADGMHENNRAWLERLIQACEGAADRLRTMDDPAQEPLLEDIQQLRARLQRQLDELGH